MAEAVSQSNGETHAENINNFTITEEIVVKNNENPKLKTAEKGYRSDKLMNFLNNETNAENINSFIITEYLAMIKNNEFPKTEVDEIGYESDMNILNNETENIKNYTIAEYLAMDTDDEDSDIEIIEKGYKSDKIMNNLDNETNAGKINKNFTITEYNSEPIIDIIENNDMSEEGVIIINNNKNDCLV